MRVRNTFCQAVLPVLGWLGLFATQSPTHALTAYTNNYVTLVLTGFDQNATPGTEIIAYVDDTNFLASASYVFGTQNGTFTLPQSLNSDADYFYWGLASRINNNEGVDFILDQSALDLGFYYTESNWIVESREFDMTLNFAYVAPNMFGNGDSVLSASLEVVGNNPSPTPVPLPPSLPVLASGLLALALVRFASRGARR